MSLLKRGHDKTLSERSIEDILFFFPYLIDRRLKASDMEEKKFVLQDGSIPDLTFRTKLENIVVELKKGRIEEAHLDQLIHYLTNLKQRENKKVSGILVGSGIVDKSLLKDKIKKSSFEILLKVYGTDVPTIIKFCKNCRHANSSLRSSCEYDGCTDFFY
jgi:hypothetical protein